MIPIAPHELHLTQRVRAGCNQSSEEASTCRKDCAARIFPFTSVCLAQISNASNPLTKCCYVISQLTFKKGSRQSTRLWQQPIALYMTDQHQQPCPQCGQNTFDFEDTSIGLVCSCGYVIDDSILVHQRNYEGVGDAQGVHVTAEDDGTRAGNL